MFVDYKTLTDYSLLTYFQYDNARHNLTTSMFYDIMQPIANSNLISIQNTSR